MTMDWGLGIGDSGLGIRDWGLEIGDSGSSGGVPTVSPITVLRP